MTQPTSKPDIVYLPACLSGHGQFDTIKPDRQLGSVTMEQIRAMVDNPQDVPKGNAQWLIPSTLHSRVFAEQAQNGQFYYLWADLDANTLFDGLFNLTMDILRQSDFELYTSKSATLERPKSRILVPLDKPLSGSDWMLCQKIFNDHLEQGFGYRTIPDRASERPAQLCFLPNRGNHYRSRNVREGRFFDPLKNWRKRLEECRAYVEKRTAETAQARLEAAQRRADKAAMRSLLGDNSESLIAAFNAAYDPADILLMSGYHQSGFRFSHPNSESGSYSASVKDSRVHSLSSSDPLYTGGIGGGAHDAFSAFAILKHEGNQNAALRDAGENWVRIGSESWNLVRRREYTQTQQAAVVGISDSIERLLESRKAQVDTKPAYRYKLLTGDDVARLPAIDWTLQGIIPATGLGATYGESGCGKSLLILGLACAIAEGSEWFGFRTRQRPVVYLSLESSGNMGNRTRAWSQHNGRPIPAELRFVFENFALTQPADVANLITDVCAQLNVQDRNAVIIIDTLARASVGLEENSAADMGKLVAATDAVAKSLGAFVLLVHHSGKNQSSGMRGSSALLGAMDVTIEVTKEGGAKQWAVRKSKDGEGDQNKVFSLMGVTLGADSEGEPITSAVVCPAQFEVTPLPKMSKTQEQAERSLVEATRKHGVIRGEVYGVHVEQWRPVFYSASTADSDSGKRSAFNTARKSLVECGLAAKDDSDHYWLTDKIQQSVFCLERKKDEV